MKKLFLIAIAIFTLQVTAQKQNHQGKKSFLKDLSAEQIAELKTKKMTLHLDLTKVQQDKIFKMNLDLAKERKYKMEKFQKRDKDVKLSTDEKFQKQMDYLDKQTANKKEMQSILNKDQFQKWEKMQMHRKSKKRKHGKGKKGQEGKKRLQKS